MTPQEFREAGVALFGQWGWQTRLAEHLRVHVTSVQRWAAGQVPIPGPVEVAVRCLGSRTVWRTINYSSGHRLEDNGVGDYQAVCPEHGVLGFAHFGIVVAYGTPEFPTCGACGKDIGTTEDDLFVRNHLLGGA